MCFYFVGFLRARDDQRGGTADKSLFHHTESGFFGFWLRRTQQINSTKLLLISAQTNILVNEIVSAETDHLLQLSTNCFDEKFSTT